MFKSEKEFLEFMLKYQQVISERDSGIKLRNPVFVSHFSILLCFLNIFAFLSFLFYVAITVRDKLESLCRELQRQNKMLMVYIPFFFLFYSTWFAL